MRWGLLLCLLVLDSLAAAQDVSFRRDIAPMLEAKCVRCHSGSTPKGELDLSTARGLSSGGSSGAVIQPGKASESLLFEMVADHKMPPKEKLSGQDLATIRRWIDSGAKWEGGTLRRAAKNVEAPHRAGLDWWSFQPIRRPVVPSVKATDWVRNPIDAYILSTLEANRLSPAPETDRRNYVRRVTFDLIGLPPTPEEVTAFVNDRSSDAYERLVDRLLASPHFGEKWGRHWLDVVRFGESHGYETNEIRRNAWPYRDWVIRAFNEDKPFRRFVLEQLAGDVVAQGDPGVEVATGFLVGGTHDIVGNETPEGKAQQRQDDLYDMVSTTGAAFLGLTVNCARCHDHKFDPITQHDYYALQAIFAGVHHGVRPVHDSEKQKELDRLTVELRTLRERMQALEAETSQVGSPRPAINTEVFPAVEAKFVRFTILATARNDEPCIDELEIWSTNELPGNVALTGKATASSAFPDMTIHKIAHLQDGQVGNSHSWISNERGHGWAQIELKVPTTINRVVWGRDRERRFDDRLATRYRIEVSRDGQAWTLVCTEADRRNRQTDSTLARKMTELKDLENARREVEKRASAVRDRLLVYCGSFSTPEPTYLLKRGDALQRQEPVQPGTIQFLGNSLALKSNAAGSERRRALAEWITNPKNPLPARVMVNRLWHYHFGRGLVGTPSDFGFNGERPTHPGLLDWLAAEFLARGGRMKPIHRLIVLSNAYRQACTTDAVLREQATAVDADNRLLWHAPRRRLEAETLRDATLAACGNLDGRMGGPGYELWDMSNYVVVFKPKETLPPDAYRRMVYQFKPRTQQDPTFGAFDCPDATQTMPHRNVSTTALQALNLLHSRFMLDQCHHFAERLRNEAGDDVPAQVRRGFLLAFSRTPSAREEQASVEAVQHHGLDAFCRALLNANEFLFLD